MTYAPRRNPLFRQFIGRLAPPMLLTLALAWAANIIVGYHMAYKEQTHRQQLIGDAYAQSLAKPLWDCDDTAALAIADSMLQTTSIEGALLYSTCTGNTLRSGAQEHLEQGGSHSRRTLHYRDGSGRDFEVGTLDMFFKPVSIMQSAADSLWFYLLVTTVMALCLALVTLLTFRNLISRPLTAFQRVIKQHGQGDDIALREVLPTGSRNDELTDVLKAYDNLMGTIADQRDALEHQARVDPLTGLGNRLRLDECFAEALDRAREHGGTGFVVLIDLDEFKPINDTLGHAAGDAVLQAAAKRLRRAVRDGDTVIRLGGDEFVLIIAAGNPPAPVQNIIARVRDQLAAPLDYEGHSIAIKASMGVAPFDAHTPHCDALLTQADQSMYEDKSARKTGR